MASKRGCNLKMRGDDAVGTTTTVCLAPAKDDVLSVSAAEELPPEMFYQIFKNVDKKSLKNSREVCTTWRNAIDDNGKLFKSFTFTIVDMQQFMNSSIASKVKSVKFPQPLKGTRKSLEKFFKKIESTVEEVFLTFGEHGNVGAVVGVGMTRIERLRREKLMSCMLLRFCTKVNTLTIESLDDKYVFLDDCVKDPRCELTLSMVQSLSINVNEKCLDNLQKLLVKLPNLHQLELSRDKGLFFDFGSHTNVAQKFYNIMLEHLRKFDGKLHDISLATIPTIIHKSAANVIIKLLLSVGQLYPNTNVNCLANLNAFVKLRATEVIQINKISCRPIKSGFLVFRDNYDNDFDPAAAFDTDKIALCSNLQHLTIFIDQLLSLVNLGFIKELKKLTYLRIDHHSRTVANDDDEEEDQEQAEDNFLSPEIFLYGIPSLTTLELQQGVDINTFPFHLCFPNLTKLYLRHYSIVLNDDFIFNLTHLDQLRSLTFEHIAELTDEHLTRVYDFTEAEDGEISKLPAIVGFRRLRKLHIADCVKLTNNCLTNGLALSNKLEKITLCYLNYKGAKGRFTRIGVNALKQARNYIVEDLPESHDRKHSAISLSIPPAKFKRFTIRS